MEPKKYTIGNKTYVQSKLVLGQWKELGSIVPKLYIPADFTPVGIIIALGDNLFNVLSIVLTEEGKPLKGKDIPALADEIEYGITPETAIEVIADFFECNPIASILNALNGLGVTIRENLQKVIGSMNYASSLATETSLSETGYSGIQLLTTLNSGQSE